MNAHKRFRRDLDDQAFGNPFDPVLSGVAQGLARLFPPVESVGVREHDETVIELGEPDAEQPDE